jgi:chromosome segregation ATPase
VDTTDNPENVEPVAGEESETVPVEEHRKMQATFNQKFDGLSKQLEQARGAREEAEGQVADLRGRLSALEAEIQDVGEDGTVNPAAVKALRREHAQTTERLDQARRAGWRLAARSEAGGLALELGLKSEDRDRIAGEIGDVTSQKELELAVREIRMRLKEEAAEAAGEKTIPKKPEVDGGKPTATKRGVLDELRAIDMSTPEGREEFNKKRSDFQRRVAAS